jgi:hypothetical protein
LLSGIGQGRKTSMMIPTPQRPSQPAVNLRTALPPRLRQVFFICLLASVVLSNAAQPSTNTIPEIARRRPLSPSRLTPESLSFTRMWNGGRPGDRATHFIE